MDLAFFAQATLLSGLAVTLATELLKSKYIPVPAKAHPRTTALVLSLVASVVEVYQYNSTHLVALSAHAFIALAFLVLLVAAMTYDHIIYGA